MHAIDLFVYWLVAVIAMDDREVYMRLICFYFVCRFVFEAIDALLNALCRVCEWAWPLVYSFLGKCDNYVRAPPCQCLSCTN